VGLTVPGNEGGLTRVERLKATAQPPPFGLDATAVGF
jgi:hypothetical protein